MRLVIVVALGIALLGAGGCAGDKGKELWDTAQFEEKQHNLEHATRLYTEIVARYPGSPYARKAEERMAELKKPR